MEGADSQQRTEEKKQAVLQKRRQANAEMPADEKQAVLQKRRQANVEMPAEEKQAVLHKRRQEGAKTDMLISSGKQKKQWKRRRYQAMNSELCNLEFPVFRASGMRNSLQGTIFEMD